jgi:NAD(P)H-hydrate repair Nnr-like enzyme with NAD(P)H-hydrate epimerase domain
VVAVDIPSGLSADTGTYIGAEDLPPEHRRIVAHLTVSFHRPKLGHLRADGPTHCGTLVVKDIGL